jgi:hydrogenase maturation protease
MLAIVGCGNPTRSDDGLGPLVARRLGARLAASGRTDVRAFDAGTDGMAVMFAARGCDALVIVDAARTGIEPGAIYEVPGEVLAREYPASLNLHDFRWNHALASGRRIFGEAFPAAITVLLVEVANTDFGLDLSPRVAAAAETIVARLERIVDAYRMTSPVVGTTA